MPVIDQDVFIRIPGESDARILHPARVTATADGSIAVEIVEPDLEFDAGQDVVLYFEHRREFMQQAARIDATLPGDDETAPLVGIQTIGEPVSAESRQCHRVSTLLAELDAVVAHEPCRLTDVSATGFSVIATSDHRIGAQVDAVLHHADRNFPGQAVVQSVKDLGGGRIRYGLHCIDDKRRGGELLRGLQQISMSVQREQLRRLAGA